MITSSSPRSVASIKQELAGTIDRVFAALQELQGNLQRVAVSTSLLYPIEVQDNVAVADTVLGVDRILSPAKDHFAMDPPASSERDILVDDKQWTQHPKKSSKGTSTSRSDDGSWTFISHAETELSSFIMLSSEAPSTVQSSSAHKELDSLISGDELPGVLLKEVGSWAHQSLLLDPLNQAKIVPVHSHSLNQEDLCLEELMQSAVIRNEHDSIALRVLVEALERGIFAEGSGAQSSLPASDCNYSATNNPPWTHLCALQA